MTRKSLIVLSLTAPIALGTLAFVGGCGDDHYHDHDNDHHDDVIVVPQDHHDDAHIDDAHQDDDHRRSVAGRSGFPRMIKFGCLHRLAWVRTQQELTMNRKSLFVLTLTAPIAFGMLAFMGGCADSHADDNQSARANDPHQYQDVVAQPQDQHEVVHTDQVHPDDDHQ